MAQMYPSHGPITETTSDAERKVYYALQRSLSDGYRVYHGVTWQSKEDDGSVRDGEVDFVIVHQNIGLLLVEVKGGLIECETARHWYSTDRFGVQHIIKNPFEQVRNAVHVLKRHLEHAWPTNAYGTEYRFASGIWLPDMKWQRGRLSHPQMRDEQILDVADLSDPTQAVLRLVRDCESESELSRPLSKGAIEALHEMFEPTLKWHLGDVVASEKTVFAKLTQEQYVQLDRIARTRQLAVQGAAGTGKTMIAMAKALQLARSGLDVLFLCSNPFLAARIKGELTDTKNRKGKTPTVQYLDELCLALAYQAQIPEAVRVLSNDADRVRLLAQSTRTLETRDQMPMYDAILVDEAQDFGQAIWPYLGKLRRDRDNGLLYLFYDPAQRTDGQEWKPPSLVKREDHVLTSNCRNTQAIFREVRRFYSGRIQPTCAGPEGRRVEFVPPLEGATRNREADPNTEITDMRRLLDQLIEDQRVSPEDILIITCKRHLNTSRWYARDVFGRHSHTWHTDKTKPGYIKVSSIRTAKGLESPIVILSELDGLSEQDNRQTLLYIAISRAMSHLIVMGTPDQLC